MPGGGFVPTRLEDLFADVSITSVATGQPLLWNGTNWVNGGNIILPVGAANSASLGFVGDVNTGLYRWASSVLGVTLGGIVYHIFSANAIQTLGQFVATASLGAADVGWDRNSAGNWNVTDASAAVYATIGKAGLTLLPVARSSGVAPYVQIVTRADTALTASTAAPGICFGGTNANPPATVTRTWATGAFAGTQSENLFTAPTYNTVGASSWAGATLATVTITGSPAAGGNISGSPAAYALNVAAGNSSFGGTSFWNSNKLQLESTANNTFLWGTGGAIVLAGTGNMYFQTGGAYRGFLDFNGWNIGDNTSAVAQLSVLSQAAGRISGVFQGAASRTVALVNLKTSAGGSLGNVSGGCFFDVFADVSTTSTDGTLDTLRTDTFVANALIVNGDKIYFDYTLTAASSATATSRFLLSFAGITFFDSGALTIGAISGVVRISGYITRKTSTTARATIFFDTNATTILFGEVTYTPDGTLTGLTLTGTNNLVLKAARASGGAANGDIVLTQGTGGITGFGS